MADELSINIAVSETKNGVTFALDFNDTFDVSGNSPIFEVKSIATSDTTLDLGAVGTPGYLIAKNLDGTNYVTLGGDGTNYFDKLKAGEFMVKRWNGAAIHAKANTGACLLQYLLIPD
jgi:hypothetical protein